MIWSQKLAQQTSQLPMQKEHKKCTTSLMLIKKISTTNSTTNHKKKHNKPTTFRLKSTTSQPKSLHRSPPQTPRLAWTPGSQVFQTKD